MFNWIMYLQLAKDLIKRTDEASQRSAVSRAYYAAFCSARNRLRDREGATIPKTSAAHSAVWDEFQSSAEIRRRQIGQLGHRLKRARAKVDYDDNVPGLSQLAEDAMEEADKLISILLSL
jgi:uncharacterized protein (UPF0332 family)